MIFYKSKPGTRVKEGIIIIKVICIAKRISSDRSTMSEKTAREQWDSLAKSRLESMQRKERIRTTNLYEEACWRFIEPLLPAGEGRILEAGCGTGRWVFRLAPLGHRIVLADFSPEMVRLAARQVEQRGVSGRVEACHVMDICNMHGLSDAGFDMALALGEPVGLCGNAGRAIRELCRVAKPGGIVAFDASNRFRRALDLARKNDWGHAAQLLDSSRSGAQSGFPHRSFTPSELRELFVSVGLEVLHVAAVCPFLSFPPDKGQMAALEADDAYAAARDMFVRFAEAPEMIAVSARLLIVGRKR